MESSKRVAVITGAASGIGLALTKSCIRRKIHVVMADNNVTNLCDQVEQLSLQDEAVVHGVVCDVTNPENLHHLAKQTVERFNRIDWLFNNAGISGHLASLWELPSEHIRKVMDVNLYGIIHSLHAFLPYLFKQKQRSHVINIASIYGLCSGSQMAAYSMSKHAILALSESLYFDLQRLNKPVDVSVVCPSFANTALLANSPPLHSSGLYYMMKELMAKSRPAEDIAEHIVGEVEKRVFYILPDKEVKSYCEQRCKAIINQNQPYPHTLEKIMTSLSQRAQLLTSQEAEV